MDENLAKEKQLGIHTDQVEPIMQFFECSHLPEPLRSISFNFQQLAKWMVGAGADEGLPRNPERTVALRKLLEAKDAAVRAKIFK